MALFPRRIVQRELDFLRNRVLRPCQAKRIVGQLNSASRQALSTEWEVVVLGGYARHSVVQHEPRIGNGFPDLYVSTNTGKSSLVFIADIVTASDFGTHEKYPVWFLYSRILMMALKLGVDFKTLGWHIGHTIEGKYPKQRIKVLLPPKAKIQALLQTSIKPFLLRVRAEPLVSRELAWIEPGVDFKLMHDPSQRESRFGGPLIATAAYSLTENPLYERLREKARALQKTKFEGLMGIVAVDGGCDSIRSPVGGGGSYDPRKIVAHFFTHYPAIAFVTTTYCEYRTGYAARGYQLYHHIHFQRDLTSEVKRDLDHLIREALSEIPEPIQSPQNALTDIITRKELDRGCGLGAYEWTPLRKLSIPVPVFLSLITRTLVDRDFELLFYKTMPPDGGPLVHFFNAIQNSGCPLTQVSIRRCPARDHDWITFEIGSSAPEMISTVGSTVEESCDLPTSVVVGYLAGLDYSMTSGKANVSDAPPISATQRDYILAVLSEGRLPESAQLIQATKAIRLSFGPRDASISAYF